jgi:hypothetical protein
LPGFVQESCQFFAGCGEINFFRANHNFFAQSFKEREAEINGSQGT